MDILHNFSFDSPCESHCYLTALADQTVPTLPHFTTRSVDLTPM